MDISTGKLQQLVTVARSGSFSRAASDLNISQPALSRSIAAIEDRYGFRIFDRMGHGVQLTVAGAQVIAQAEPLLQSMHVFDSNLRLFGSGKAGQLQLGLAPLLASQLLPRFATEFFSPESAAQLRVVIRRGPDLLDLLKTGAIELFFFPESLIDPVPEIEIVPIGRIAVSLVVRSGHPLAGREGLTLADLRGFPWGSSVKPPIPEDILGPALFICDNYHILRETALNSDLICIASRTFVSEQLRGGTLTEIVVEGLPLPDATIYMAKLKGRMNSPLAEEAVQRFGEYLRVG
ncbi:MAG: LysR family transcriptional regulator [Sphingobium sp.]